MSKKRYVGHLYVINEGGRPETPLGSFNVMAESINEAKRLVMESKWDDRLSSAGCSPMFCIEEQHLSVEPDKWPTQIPGWDETPTARITEILALIWQAKLDLGRPDYDHYGELRDRLLSLADLVGGFDCDLKDFDVDKSIDDFNSIRATLTGLEEESFCDPIVPGERAGDVKGLVGGTPEKGVSDGN